jgi:hypothetical protein
MSNTNKIDLAEWNRWFLKYVYPVFDLKIREEYYDNLKKQQVPFYPKYWIAEKFYNSIKDDIRFDEELKLFFSFLYSCGFFMENIITFEDWLRMKNWINPSNLNIIENSILEILNQPNGSDILKNQLRWFPFLNREDGY